VVRVTQQLVLSEPLDIPIPKGVGEYDAESVVLSVLAQLGIKCGSIDVVGTTTFSCLRVNPVPS
jgi:hypothetical protein